MILDLQPKEFEYIVNLLCTRPYGEVFQLIENLRQQTERQQQQAQAGPRLVSGTDGTTG